MVWAGLFSALYTDGSHVTVAWPVNSNSMSLYILTQSCSAEWQRDAWPTKCRCWLSCSTSAGVKTMVLLTFCDEGDNSQDACDLVSYLNTWTRWIPPSQVVHWDSSTGRWLSNVVSVTSDVSHDSGCLTGDRFFVVSDDVDLMQFDHACRLLTAALSMILRRTKRQKGDILRKKCYLLVLSH